MTRSQTPDSAQWLAAQPVRAALACYLPTAQKAQEMEEAQEAADARAHWEQEAAAQALEAPSMQEAR